MSDPQKPLGHVGVVIRADGTVPFDDDCHPDVRRNILGWLLEQGHTVSPVHGTKHVRIHNWKKPEAHSAPVTQEELDQVEQEFPSKEKPNAVDTSAVSGAAQPQPDAGPGEKGE